MQKKKLAVAHLLSRLPTLICEFPARGAAKAQWFFSVLVVPTEPSSSVCSLHSPRLLPRLSPPGAWSASKWSGLPPAMEPLVKCHAAAATGWPWDKLSVNNAAGFRNSPRTGQHHSGRVVIINYHCAAFNLLPATQAIHTQQKCELLSSTQQQFRHGAESLINSKTEGAPLERSFQQKPKKSWTIKEIIKYCRFRDQFERAATLKRSYSLG